MHGSNALLSIQQTHREIVDKSEIVSSQKSEEKNIFFFQFRASKAVLQTALCGP
jgi:hypothetical protein